MSIVAEYIDKLNLTIVAAWLITGLLLLFAGRYLKEVISFVLMNLYEIFIGSENHEAPY